MKVTSFTHWIGVFLLFISAILLLVTSITSPVTTDLNILHVELTNKTTIRNSSVNFGTFGYCILDVPPDNADHDWCSTKMIGYKPASIMDAIDHTKFSSIGSGTSDSLTDALILHPIACGLAFIAFIISIGAGVLGSLIGAFVAFVAWILTLVVMVIDFTLFGIIKNHVNADGSGSVATFGEGMWTVLAAFVTLFFGMIIVFITCCSARREKKRSGAVKNEGNYTGQPAYGEQSYGEERYDTGPGQPVRNKRFGRF